MLKKIESILIVLAIITAMLIYPAAIGTFWEVAIGKYWYVIIVIIFIASYVATKESKKANKEKH